MILEEFIRKQIDWSKRVFGEGKRTQQVTKHIAKELVEIDIAPDDLMEWVDVILLALDGAWRAGYSAEEICWAMKEKQKTNFNREWVIPTSDNEPIEHKRENK